MRELEKEERGEEGVKGGNERNGKEGGRKREGDRKERRRCEREKKEGIR